MASASPVTQVDSVSRLIKNPAMESKKRIIIIAAVLASLVVIYHLWWIVTEPSFGRYSYPYFVFLDARVRRLPIVEPVRVAPNYRYIHPEGEVPEAYQLMYATSASIDSLKQAYRDYFRLLGYREDAVVERPEKLVFNLSDDYFYIEFNTENGADKPVAVVVSLVLK